MNEDRVTLPVNEEMWPMGETLRDEKYGNMMSWAHSRAIPEIRTGMICTEIATQLFLQAGGNDHPTSGTVCQDIQASLKAIAQHMCSTCKSTLRLSF